MKSRTRNSRRAVIVRLAVGVGPAPLPPSPEPTTDAEPVLLSKERTRALLAISRGLQFPVPVTMRRWLLRSQLMRPAGESQRKYTLTALGRASMAASEHLSWAQRALDANRRS